MTDQQPNALRLANDAMCRLPGNDGAEIAAELRRLHAAESAARVELLRRQNLIDSLEGLVDGLDSAYKEAMASLKIAVGERDELRRLQAERGDELTPSRIFGLADVHADESLEDGRRIFDRDGLIGFAEDAARIGAAPAQGVLLGEFVDNAIMWANPGEPIPPSGTKIYAHAAPALVPLSDEQIFNLYCKSDSVMDTHITNLVAFARAIEQAHGIGLTVGGDGGEP